MDKPVNSRHKVSSGGTLEIILNRIYSHPILAAAWLCLCSLCLSLDSVNPVSLVFVSSGLAALGTVGGIMCIKKLPKPVGRNFAGMVFACAAAVIFLFCGLSVSRNSYVLVLMQLGMAVVIAAAFSLAAMGKLNTKSIILLLFAAGFIMRLSYVVCMPVRMIQHDVYYIGDGAGHSGYIEYLLQKGHLPDFDVREVDQFYHPPLHHLLAALWMRIQLAIGIGYEAAYENIQLLTLFYSTVSFILSYKIFRRVGLSGSGLIAATAIIAFCPTFYIMSGSINNDILSITLMLGAVYNTLCWFKKRSLPRILCIALCIGFGMMTKLSVWMAAPPIAFIFIYAFFSDLRHWKKYIIQYPLFLAVSVPLGLFWSVRNVLRWGVPLTYVPKLSETSMQYVGDVPVITRLFDISAFQFKDVSEQFVMYGGSYNEYNPLVGFFKTSMFDEGIAPRRFPRIEGMNHILFWSAVILGLLGFVAMIIMAVRKNKVLRVPVRVFICSLYLLILVMYYYFCIEYPHVCTQNVRYGVPLIVIGALSSGYLIQVLMSSKGTVRRVLACGIGAVIGVYAISGYIVYNTAASSFIH